MVDTYFAPAARTEVGEFNDQIESLTHSPIMNALLETMAGLLVVLNEDRQIVAMNHAFLAAIGIKNAEEALGLRLGESLGCVHAQEEPHGCGTTAYCGTCGAAIAMMTAINDDMVSEEICALTAEMGGVVQELCMLIRAQPMRLENKRWILIFAQDITQQQFWVNLERVFFHDINNLLSPLLGNIEFMAMENPNDADVVQLQESIVRLCSEVSLQRSLIQKKDIKYLLQKADTSVLEIKKDVDTILYGHNAARGRQIETAWPVEDVNIDTDKLLVSRVLGNMMINALEASKAGGLVRLTTEVTPEAVAWHVWNEGGIDKGIQKRIFQRHFSTKSKTGRGLGTFSMKLFGEKYLGGQVGFVSSPEEGTTFTFRLLH